MNRKDMHASNHLPNHVLPLLMMAPLLCTACQPSVLIDTQVWLPWEYSRKISVDAPRWMVLHIDVPKTGEFAWTMGLLCEPLEEDLQTWMLFERFGCARSGIVESWLQEASPDDIDFFGCNLETISYYDTISSASGQSGAISPPDGVLHDSVQVFTSKTSDFGCSSGEESVSLTLR